MPALIYALTQSVGLTLVIVASFTDLEATLRLPTVLSSEYYKDIASPSYL